MAGIGIGQFYFQRTPEGGLQIECEDNEGGITGIAMPKSELKKIIQNLLTTQELREELAVSVIVDRLVGRKNT